MTVSDTSLITHEFSFRADWKGGATVATIVHATCNMQQLLEVAQSLWHPKHISSVCCSTTVTFYVFVLFHLPKLKMLTFVAN